MGGSSSPPCWLSSWTARRGRRVVDNTIAPTEVGARELGTPDKHLAQIAVLLRSKFQYRATAGIEDEALCRVSNIGSHPGTARLWPLRMLNRVVTERGLTLGG